MIARTNGQEIELVHQFVFKPKTDRTCSRELAHRFANLAGDLVLISPLTHDRVHRDVG